MEAEEFIRRFLLHVPPAGFQQQGRQHRLGTRASSVRIRSSARVATG
ncbi:MAG: transposase [Verrucomicrobia bacterium]|nr:transposase [Verrucomicrobiota bacterium]